MADQSAELKLAYEAIYLAEMRGQISREEREARVIALRETLGAGLSFEQRNTIANKAVHSAAEIMDEVNFSPSGGKWQ